MRIARELHDGLGPVLTGAVMRMDAAANLLDADTDRARSALGEARTDVAIMSALHHRLKALYAKEGGAFADPILNLDWKYAQPDHPSSEEIAKEYNGRALTDLTDAEGKVLRPAGQQLSGFGDRKSVV